MNDPPFYKTDSDLDFRLLYRDNRKIRHRELDHLCIESVPVGQVVDRRTAPYDRVNEDILKKEKKKCLMLISIKIMNSLNVNSVLFVFCWSNLFFNKKIGPIDKWRYFYYSQFCVIDVRCDDNPRFWANFVWSHSQIVFSEGLMPHSAGENTSQVSSWIQIHKICILLFPFIKMQTKLNCLITLVGIHFFK